MSNSYFQFKQFTIHQDRCAMKVTTDACLFGAWAAEEIKSQKSKIKNILDIGSGTGLLALMMAQKIEQANIDSIEIDKDSFEQATENSMVSPWGESIHIIHADARTFSPGKKYEIIISNPPFYENELKSDDKKKNTAHHSDELSIADLLTIIKENLSTNGTFYLLLPYKRNEEIKKLIMANDLFVEEIVLVRQSVKHDHFRIMLAGKLKATGMNETAINEIAIRNGEDYTDDFKSLLKDYYLHL